MREDGRLRSALEIATAILLGLVSVATAAGAYQASEWSQQSNAYASISSQLRDDSLASGIASQLAGFDDNERLSDALAIEFEIMEGGEDPALREEQALRLEGGSPGLALEWNEWVESGYSDGEYPATEPEFVAAQLAPTYGANRASADAYRISQDLGERSLLVTVSSAIFALALLLLGVSGAYRSLKVSLATAIGGAGAFLAGTAISLVAILA